MHRFSSIVENIVARFQKMDDETSESRRWYNRFDYRPLTIEEIAVREEEEEEDREADRAYLASIAQTAITQLYEENVWKQEHCKVTHALCTGSGVYQWFNENDYSHYFVRRETEDA